MTHVYVSVTRKYANKSRGDLAFIICGRLGRVICFALCKKWGGVIQGQITQ